MEHTSSDTSATRDEVARALCRVVADRGVEGVSVREVAAEAGVAPGTVQYHFPTRTAMLAGAFEAVVARVRVRLAGVRLGDDPVAGICAVLRQLLPLDDGSAEEARVVLGFAAAASHEPALMTIQRDLLATMRDELAAVVARASGKRRVDAQARAAALVVLAAVDGLALHEVSSGGDLGRRRVDAGLDLVVRSVVGPVVRRSPGA